MSRFDRLPLQSRLRWAAAACLGTAWLLTMVLWAAFGAPRLAAAGALLAVLLAGVWLAIQIADLRKNQDCVLSGRRDCAPIDVNARERK